MNTEQIISLFETFTDCRRDLIAAIAEHLTASGISYSNEFSDARWVYRFRTGLDYPENRALLAALP